MGIKQGGLFKKIKIIIPSKGFLEASKEIKSSGNQRQKWWFPIQLELSTEKDDLTTKNLTQLWNMALLLDDLPNLLDDFVNLLDHLPWFT